MAEHVQRHLEDMMEVFEVLERLQLFSHKEVKQVIKRCKIYEYKLQKSAKKKHEIIQYIQLACHRFPNDENLWLSRIEFAKVRVCQKLQVDNS
ncbi:unnamed protein product [Soboliphyme baturini]|uniref:U3 small nucleolar RNA-associated protein 6 homolog n=1 Tax=Soboliphyme baturini TaxID=241478 RepID=A0A183J9C2_9BILA|nr:unnamed protein product [Soboliphyme baturini]